MHSAGWNLSFRAGYQCNTLFKLFFNILKISYSQQERSDADHILKNHDQGLRKFSWGRKDCTPGSPYFIFNTICNLWNHINFYYISIRSLSLGAPFRHRFLILVVLSLSSLCTVLWCMCNITPGGNDARVVGTSGKRLITCYCFRPTRGFVSNKTGR